jgi:hypothetical protein
MKIKLTDSEWAILEHRLDLTDCLAECYASTMYCNAEDAGRVMSDEEHKALEEKAEAAAVKLNLEIRRTREIDTDSLTELDKWLLADCLDGTTYFCGIEDAVWDKEISRGKAMSMRKAGYSIQRKFNEAGIICQICLE